MRKQGATPTRLDVLGASTTMAASLPEVKFQGNSDCKSNPRYVCSYMYAFMYDNTNNNNYSFPCFYRGMSVGKLC